MQSDRVLIVDDIPSFLEDVSHTIESAGLLPIPCDDPRNAPALLAEHQPAAMITTLVMREMGGFDLIRRVRGEGASIPIIMVTGYGSAESEREAVRLGCWDYLNKPVDKRELVSRVRRACRHAEPRKPGTHQLGRMVSADASMKSVMQTVEKIAPSRCRVLILGETGTGKQLLAQAIHEKSDRAPQPFVEVNCAAIPENLLESELFGHRRGAFTDASRDRIGRFEQAGEGTIFLDEIGEMPLGLQAKLLHVLEDGQYQRVGDENVRFSNARVIAATNRHLLRDVEAGRFRSDLFYRLNVVSIHLPALRERPGDIPLLIQHFMEMHAAEGSAFRIDPDAMVRLEQYLWPGNVRELQNVIERFAALKHDEYVKVEDLPPRILGEKNAGGATGHLLDGPYRKAKQRFEHAYLEQCIRAAEGNFAAAAREAGLDRGQFFRMARRHGLTSRH